MESVKFAEVTRSPFYMPHYVAVALELYQQAGIRPDCVVRGTAESAIDGLLDGELDVGVFSPMRLLLDDPRAAVDRLGCLATVNSRVGFYLIGRPGRAFSWPDLMDQKLIVFGEAPTPWACLRVILERLDLDPARIETVDGLDTPHAVEAFLDGRADHLLQFEPYATRLEAAGTGTVVASLGAEVGPVTFSAYVCARAGYQSRPQVYDTVADCLGAAKRWLAGASDREVVDLVGDMFDLDSALLERIVHRYRRDGAWAAGPEVVPSELRRLQAILTKAELNVRGVDVEDLIVPRPEPAVAHHRNGRL